MKREAKIPFGALTGPYLLIVYLVGAMAVFVGERIIGGVEGIRLVVSSAGGALMLLSTALWFVAWFRSKEPARTVERLMALLSMGGVFALLVYFLGSDIVMGPMPVIRSGETAIGKREVFSVLWPIALLCSLLPLVLVQWSAASMARGKGVEPFRANASARAGATIASMLSALMLLNAVANEKDVHADLSYFKTALPSDSTKDLIATMKEETSAILFFPEVSEVKDAVLPYFEALKGLSSNFKVELLDAATAPDAARKHRVSKDGAVVIARGSSSEKLQLGDTMDGARSKLRSLDADLQKIVMKLTVEKKTVYVISGHGERAEKKDDKDTRSPIGVLAKILETSNMTVKKLGPVEGLASGVPDDAAVVIWTDPGASPFQGETDAIKSYLEGGGRMLLTLDPANAPDMEQLLSFIGVSYSKARLMNDKAYIPITRTDADKQNIITASFSSHPSVGSFSNKQTLVPVLFPGVGSLEKAPGTKSKVTFTVLAPSGTWRDDNGDLARNEDEKTMGYNLAAAVSAKPVKQAKGENKSSASSEMRVVVFADTDVFADDYIGFRLGYSNVPGNVQLLADSLEWLVGQGQVADIVSGEEDIRIAHTRDEDVLWFYATIFAIPMLIVGVGVATRWGRGRKRRSK